jgi:hypothetical protein
MTHRATGPSLPKIWLLPVLAVLTLAGLVLAEVLSPSLALDFIALWPVWVLVALIALLVRGRRLGRVRLSGLVPVLATLLVGVLLIAHLLGWPAMPSSAPALVGPSLNGVETAALSARIDGEIRLREGAEHLYLVQPLRQGGEIGVPDAREQAAESAVVIELVPDPDPGLYAFSGWDVILSAVPTWSLTLDGEVDADLAGLRISGVQAEGRGRLILGPVPGPTPVSVVGDFIIELPREVPIRIVGQASVPSDWEMLRDGSRSPAPGNGWVVSMTPETTLTVIYEPGPPG